MVILTILDGQYCSKRWAIRNPMLMGTIPIISWYKIQHMEVNTRTPEADFTNAVFVVVVLLILKSLVKSKKWLILSLQLISDNLKKSCEISPKP